MLRRLGCSETELDTMPWWRERAYLEEWAAEPYQTVVLIDPRLLPERPVDRRSATQERSDLAGLGFTVVKH